MWKFCRELAIESFHGVMKVLEIGEAVSATFLYAAGFFFPGVEKLLRVVSLGLLIALVLTFLIGLLLAAYRRDRKKEEEKHHLEGAAARSHEQAEQQLNQQKELHEAELAAAREREKGLLDKLSPKLRICDEIPELWSHHYRIKVENISGTTVQKCGATIAAFDPPTGYTHVPLHCSGLHPPLSDRVDIDPGVPKVFDVLRYNRHPGKLDVACPSNQDIFIPVTKYRLTIQVFGKDVPAQTKDFIFEPKGNGTFAFYPCCDACNTTQPGQNPDDFPPTGQ